MQRVSEKLFFTLEQFTYDNESVQFAWRHRVIIGKWRKDSTRIKWNGVAGLGEKQSLMCGSLVFNTSIWVQAFV